jgi:hypothetical protein
MMDHRAQLQTQPTVGGQQGITGHLGSHLAVPQDEVGQDSEYGFTGRALQTPDHDPTQPDPDIMGVARQASAPITGRLVFQLKANGQNKGEDTFDQRLAVCNEVEVGRFVSKIDGDSAVLSPWFGRRTHVSSPCHQVSQAEETQWG